MVLAGKNWVAFGPDPVDQTLMALVGKNLGIPDPDPIDQARMALAGKGLDQGNHASSALPCKDWANRGPGSID